MGLISNIRMVWSRDLLFFDRKLPLAIFWSSLSNNRAVTASPVQQVAIRLNQFKRESMVNLLWVSIDQSFLSYLILVCSNHELRSLVEVSPPDRWGFRAVSSHEVQATDPKAYETGEQIVAQFGVGISGLTYEYVAVTGLKTA